MTIPLTLYKVETSRLSPIPGILPTIYVYAPCRYDAITKVYDILGCASQADRERYSIVASATNSSVYPPVEDDRTYQELFESEDML